MAILNLKNFKKHFSDDIKLWAIKCKVRECDEVSKGQFVAFVDLGEQSFDVSLHLNPKKEITASSCDCPKGDSLCQHKFALLMHLSGNEKVTAPKLIKNKISPHQLILNELSHEDLKSWLLKLLEKDKPLKAEFIQEFSKTEDLFLTQIELEKKLKELLKAVAGAKKILEPSDFKKAMSLWENFSLNHLKIYLKNPCLNVNFEQLEFLMMALNNQIDAVRTQTFTSYKNIFKKISKETSKSIAQIIDDQSFTKAISILSSNMVNNQWYNTDILRILHETYELSDDTRKNEILNLSITKYQVFHSNSHYGDPYFTKTMWSMIKNLNQTKKHAAKILPISYNNDFNIELIGSLINDQNLDLAITYCNKILKSNLYVEYNLPYWLILKKIYKATKQTDELLEVKKQLLPFTANFEDFLEIYENMEDEIEKKQFRINLLTKFRTNMGRNQLISSDIFCIKLADYENNYVKLIEYLQYYQFIQYFVPALDKMFVYNKKKTLLNIISHFQSKYYSENETIMEQEKESFLTVYQIIIKYFTEDELVAFFRQHLPSFHRSQKGSLVSFLTKNIV